MKAIAMRNLDGRRVPAFILAAVVFSALLFPPRVLAKVLRRTLTPEQAARYAAAESSAQ